VQAETYGKEDEGTEAAPRDILGDGSLLKVTEKSGYGWEKPKELGVVDATYSARRGDATLLPETTATWTIDEDEAPLMLIERCVRTMKVREEAYVRVARVADARDAHKLGVSRADTAATGSSGSDMAVVVVKVRLNRLEPAPHASELRSDDEKRDYVRKLKDSGNAWLKRNNMHRAKRRYVSAITFGEMCEGAASKVVRRELAAARLNLAQCALTERDYREALDQCDRVVSAAGDHADVGPALRAKALYRRGVARLAMEDFEEAVKDLKAALAVLGANTEDETLARAVRSKLREAVALKKRASEKARQQYGNLFDKLSGFASENRPKGEPAPDDHSTPGPAGDDDEDWDNPPLKEPAKERDHAPGPKVFLEIEIGKDSGVKGRVSFELFADTAPKTAKNFASLCAGDAGLTYKGSIIHRVIKNFMIQGGDVTKNDGTGGTSIYGPSFDDEKPILDAHWGPGVLSMANKGPNTNSSQFFITTKAAPHLDGRHVVFGKVIDGMDLVTAIEHVSTGERDKPLSDCTILDCGVLSPGPGETTPPPPPPTGAGEGSIPVAPPAPEDSSAGAESKV